MDIIVSGRHCTISDELRELVSERIATVARWKDRIQRVEVEFTANETKGSPERAVEAEITLLGKGPVVRAEAYAEDKRTAFDKAMDKLSSQLRRASDRRKHHRGLRSHSALRNEVNGIFEDQTQTEDEVPTRNVAGIEVTGDGPLVVKEKQFSATPLTLAQALDEMELVGHDFFLYSCADTGQPAVVYRRKAYSYGVIRLAVDKEAKPA